MDSIQNTLDNTFPQHVCFKCGGSGVDCQEDQHGLIWRSPCTYCGGAGFLWWMEIDIELPDSQDLPDSQTMLE